ncbi:elongation factor P, partial [candidate division WOR-3 bacterium]|nr:elongation factor P [candidate division WOR-3 bacterium]
MITPNDFKSGTLIKYKDGIYEVLSYQRQRTAQRRARVVAKLRNIQTGSQLEESFESEVKLEEAEYERRRSQYMYADDVGFHFMDLSTYEQFALDRDAVGDKKYYLSDNCEADVVYIEGRPTTFEPPMFVVLEVTDTEPNFKGDTASGGGKPATLSTGLVVTVPFFVKLGDKVKVDTRT